MLLKNNNKALPINNVLDVQQKLFGFENFDHGRAKKRKNRKCSRTKENQSTFQVGTYKDPELIISDEYINKYYIDENNVIGSLNSICPHCKSRKVTKWDIYIQRISFLRNIVAKYNQKILLQKMPENVHNKLKRPF